MEASRPASALPVVAVVGRPNVGKSSLVNRILGRREAIVAETPGVTRDRRAFVAEWAGRRFEIIDTGGLERAAGGLSRRVAEQAEVAIAASDAILFVVDVTTGPLEDDMVAAASLRRSRKPVIVVANKVDDPRDEAAAAVFHRLGLGAPVVVSALHGRGSGDLLDILAERLPDVPEDTDGAWASLAIVGRPNVGKSSILNALVGESRAIVDAVPGTTRDPVDSLLGSASGRILRIVDTAGMRRQVRIEDPIEYFSFLRSRRTLERADAALLVVDAAEGISTFDQRIAQAIVDEGRACVVAANKWDLVGGDPVDVRRTEDSLKERFRFMDWAKRVRTSAVTGRGLARLLRAVEDAVESHRRRIPTSTLNVVLATAQDRRPHPRVAGRSVRILYGVQSRVAPPTFVLFATRPPEKPYLRYVERRIREEEPFAGSPVVLETRQRRRP